jgi:hypothetical protein
VSFCVYGRGVYGRSHMVDGPHGRYRGWWCVFVALVGAVSDWLVPMSLRTPPQAKLRELEREWKRADHATLEDPTLPECMLWAARRRLERLEEAKCQAGPQKTLLGTTND